MSKSLSKPGGSKRVGGEICLDFANTAHWHASDNPKESLGTYAGLVSWSEGAAILDTMTAERLLQEAERRPAAAKAALKRAVALREVLYRIVVAILQRRPAHAADIADFNRALASALQHLHIAPGYSGLAWGWESCRVTFDMMLWPILWSAAELLTSDKCARIGQCADDRGCGWLFLDTSKNRSRRWCEMEDCGNRAKARRHRERRRVTGSRTGSDSAGRPSRRQEIQR